MIQAVSNFKTDNSKPNQITFKSNLSKIGGGSITNRAKGTVLGELMEKGLLHTPVCIGRGHTMKEHIIGGFVIAPLYLVGEVIKSIFTK